MTTEQLCQIAIDRGYRYNPETGEIFGIRYKKSLSNKNKDGYITIAIKIDDVKKTIYAHQFAFYWVYKYLPKLVDHIKQGIEYRSDNRIINLRDGSNGVNNKNRLDKGYKKCRDNFQASIMVDYKEIHGGTYKTEEDARQAYLILKNKYHGCNYKIDYIPKKVERVKSKGYSYNKKYKRYKSYNWEDGKLKHLGSFKTEEEARQAYLNYINKKENPPD